MGGYPFFKWKCGLGLNLCITFGDLYMRLHYVMSSYLLSFNRYCCWLFDAFYHSLGISEELHSYVNK